MMYIIFMNNVSSQKKNEGKELTRNELDWIDKYASIVPLNKIDSKKR